MIPAPAETATSDLADWVEVSCLKNRNARISRSDTLDQLNDYSFVNTEEKCSLVWMELDRRSRALRSAYPFEVQAASIERRGPWQDYPLYTTLVLIGTAAHFSATRIRNYRVIAKLFENVAARAIERYIGGRAIRIGHPREAPVPTRFSKLLAFLAQELGEGLRRANPLIADTKDCRADIIAWRSFGDRRGGQLVLLTQCAVGTSWTAKLTECDVRLWERYIEFVVTPARAFAMPYVEPDDKAWLEYGTLGGIAFDRLRIVEMLPTDHMPPDLLRQARRWSSSQLSRVPWDA
jgi:hypothetical protein